MPTDEKRYDPQKKANLVNDQRQMRWEPARFLARFNLQPGQWVLDLGCGPGFWTIPLAEIVGPSGKVFALDVSQEMLDALAERHPPSNVNLILGELPTIGLPDQSVDLIWAAFLYHEVDPSSELAAEMRRVLRPGGKVGILDWRTDGQKEDGPPLNHRKSVGTVMDDLLAAGFQHMLQNWQDADAYLIIASPDRTMNDW